MSKRSSAFLNHFSVRAPGGLNAAALFERICTSDTAIEPSTEYTPGKSVAIGKIPSSDDFETLLVQTVEEVLQASDLKDFSQTLLAVGSSVGGMATTERIVFRDHAYGGVDPQMHSINAIVKMLQKRFTFKNHLSFSTACTSSANALGYAMEVIHKGVYENVLVVGADSLSFTTVRGFDSLGVLSDAPCRPFDEQRKGMNVAEAIAALLVQATPAEAAVEIAGAGYSSDAYHITHPHPEGEGAQSAMKRALEYAKIAPEQIGYINAHGTGTQANDAAEAAAVAALFGKGAAISSTKSITGHTLGAAGALEAVVTAQALQQQEIPPNCNLQTPQNGEVELPTAPRKHPFKAALSNSFAFGGNNTSLVLRLPE